MAQGVCALQSPVPMPDHQEAVTQATDAATALEQDARQEAEEARIAAEDEVIKTHDFAFGVAGIAYDYAQQTVNGAYERAIELLNQGRDAALGSKKSSYDPGASTQSTQTIVKPAVFEASLLILAASTGASMLLIWLGRRLLTLGGLPLLSRIAHSEIYENEARRTVSELVIGEPGLCLNDIVGRTGFSRNAVSYHLFVLEKEEEIVSVKDGKYRRYFTRNGKYVNGAKNVVAALRNETTLKLAQVVAQRPGAIQRELCIELGATPSATCWHAKRLLDLGVIRKEKVSNTVKYFPGEALAKYDLGDFGLPRQAPAKAAPLAV